MNVAKILGAAILAVALAVVANIAGNLLIPTDTMTVAASQPAPAKEAEAAPPVEKAEAPAPETAPAETPAAETPAAETASAEQAAVASAETPAVEATPAAEPAASEAPAVEVPAAEAAPAAQAAPAEQVAAPAETAPETAPETAAPVAPSAAVAPAETAMAGDPEAGAVVARKCKACHTFEKGGPNRVGPNLFGVVGAPVAVHDAFAYSDDLKGLGGTWTEEALDAWIANPKAVVAKTKMAFAGIKEEKDRQDLIAYLKTLK